MDATPCSGGNPPRSATQVLNPKRAGLMAHPCPSWPFSLPPEPSRVRKTGTGAEVFLTRFSDRRVGGGLAASSGRFRGSRHALSFREFSSRPSRWGAERFALRWQGNATIRQDGGGGSPLPAGVGVRGKGNVQWPSRILLDRVPAWYHSASGHLPPIREGFRQVRSQPCLTKSPSIAWVVLPMPLAPQAPALARLAGAQPRRVRCDEGWVSVPVET